MNLTMLGTDWLGSGKLPLAAGLWWLVLPLLALAFALLAVPLARSSPRQARYGRILIGFLAYLIGMNLTMLGTDWLGSGKLPLAAGLWWLVLPLLALGAWMYFDDGRVRRARLWR
jgi:lipopolysaccharide export system permease protein